MIRNTKTGEESNDNFNDLLNKFDDSKALGEWVALIDETKQREPLTIRQREAIISRCNNSIQGVYGNTKTDAQMSHTKPQKPAKQ